MRTKIGIITSNKMAKTLVVTEYRSRMHSKYQKRFRIKKKFYAHTEDSTIYKIGDSVTIAECRPLSKLKHWIVVEGKTANSLSAMVDEQPVVNS